jgi:hypothetical protein
VCERRTHLREFHERGNAQDRSGRREIEPMGNYEARPLQVQNKYTDQWARAFPKQATSLHISQVLDLPPTFNEQIIEYRLGKHPERFTIENCHFRGRKEDVGTMSYDFVQKYRGRLIMASSTSLVCLMGAREWFDWNGSVSMLFMRKVNIGSDGTMTA